MFSKISMLNRQASLHGHLLVEVQVYVVETMNNLDLLSFQA